MSDADGSPGETGDTSETSEATADANGEGTVGSGPSETPAADATTESSPAADTDDDVDLADPSAVAEEAAAAASGGEEFENLGAFLLTVTGVTAMFVAIFTFAFPPPINQYFAGIVLSVTVVTLIIGMVLDLLGYFSDDARVLTDDDEHTEPEQLEAVRAKPNVPLPKQINFDQEIRRLREHFDGELPRQMDSFLTEYQELKSTSKNRKVVAGSLRAALNPISALVDDEELEEMVDDMGDRLFAYIKADPVDNIVVTEYAFFQDGVQTQVAEQQGEQVRIKATVHNQGDTAKAEVAVRFTNAAGVPVKTAYLPVGEVVTEARKELNTSVYVPSLATDADVFVIRATQDTPVLDM